MRCAWIRDGADTDGDADADAGAEGEQERRDASHTFAYFVVAFVDDDYCRGQRLSA